MPDDDGLTDELISAVARDHGIALSRDDPIFVVIALNQRVLRAYLESTLPVVLESLRKATERAQKDMEATTEAQRFWIEQETLKDRQGFLDELRETHVSWTEEIQGLIEKQEAQLQRVVVNTVRVIQAQRESDRQADTLQRPRRGDGVGLMVAMGLVAAIIGAAAAVMVFQW